MKLRIRLEHFSPINLKLLKEISPSERRMLIMKVKTLLLKYQQLN